MNIQIAEFLDEALIEAEGALSLFIKVPISLLLLTSCLVFLYLAFKRNRPPTPTESLIATVKRMEAMASDPLCPDKEIYFTFIDALKKYLRLEFLVDIDAKNDSEIINALKKYNFSLVLTTELSSILDRAHQVRFAGQVIEKEIMGKDIVWLLGLIEQSKLRQKLHKTSH